MIIFFDCLWYIKMYVRSEKFREDFNIPKDVKLREDENWKLIEEKAKITQNILSNILYNWLYAWILEYKEYWITKRIYLYKEPELDFPILISIDEFNKIISMKDNKNRNRDTLIKTSPFPERFFITEDNKKCSFYIQPKRKHKYLELIGKWENIKEEIFLNQIIFIIKFNVVKEIIYEYMKKEKSYEKK